MENWIYNGHIRSAKLKLKRGVKPIDLNIPIDVPYTMITTGDYIEIEIQDAAQITRLRAMGFT